MSPSTTWIPWLMDHALVILFTSMVLVGTGMHMKNERIGKILVWLGMLINATFYCGFHALTLLGPYS